MSDDGEMSGVYEHDKARAFERLDAERKKRERQAEADAARRQQEVSRVAPAHAAPPRPVKPTVTLDGDDLDRLEKVVSLYGGGLLAIMENNKIAVMLPGVLQGLPALIELARAGLGVTSPAPAVQEWGAGPGQRPVPADVARACDETKAARDAYDRARDQAAQAGHPDPHGAALVALFGGKP